MPIGAYVKYAYRYRDKKIKTSPLLKSMTKSDPEFLKPAGKKCSRYSRLVARSFGRDLASAKEVA